MNDLEPAASDEPRDATPRNRTNVSEEELKQQPPSPPIQRERDILEVNSHVEK